ncbi:MAG: hypothetical protein IAI50_18235 [Candidatus Eremiobacteraeota bacterium]|nr:hypothetical protein [Candidatus Eremiobacteraeota bacterium]
MLRHKFFAAGAGAAAGLLFATRMSVAPAEAAGTQLASDTDVWRVRGRLVGMIVQLSNLQDDYGGNRSAAIAAITAAKGDLDLAVKVRNVYKPLSDTVVKVTIQEVDEMIQRLTGDNGDYNNHKLDAIGRLNAAKTSLQAAVNAIH